jgi:hypothetical protein
MVPVRPVQARADAGQDVQGRPAGVQLVLQQHQQLFNRPGDPVRLVDHQRAPGTQHAQGAAQPGPSVAAAGGRHDDLPPVRGRQRVELGLVVLTAGGDLA